MIRTVSKMIYDFDVSESRGLIFQKTHVIRYVTIHLLWKPFLIWWCIVHYRQNMFLQISSGTICFERILTTWTLRCKICVISDFIVEFWISFTFYLIISNSNLWIYGIGKGMKFLFPNMRSTKKNFTSMIFYGRSVHMEIRWLCHKYA